MAWFWKKQPQPEPALRPMSTALVSYTQIADALWEEGEAMGLDRIAVFRVSTHLIEVLDEPDSKQTHYPLNYVIGNVLVAANRAGLGMPAACELAVHMTRRLGGEDEATNCARTLAAMTGLAGAVQKLKGLDPVAAAQRGGRVGDGEGEGRAMKRTVDCTPGSGNEPFDHFIEALVVSCIEEKVAATTMLAIVFRTIRSIKGEAAAKDWGAKLIATFPENPTPEEREAATARLRAQGFDV
jgi:hypothetical protein